MDNVSAAFHILAECSNRPGDIDYTVTNKEIVLQAGLLKYTSMTRGFGPPQMLKGPCFGYNCGMARCQTILATEAALSQVCGSSVFIQ